MLNRQSVRDSRQARPRQRGFSLVELMISVAIVGVVSAIAYPSYVSHVVKSNRTAAQAHLLDLAQREQQYLADNRSYAASVGALSLSTPTAVSSKYTILIEVQAGPPPSFTITATPVTGGSQVQDGSLTINSAGTKSPAAKW